MKFNMQVYHCVKFFYHTMCTYILKWLEDEHLFSSFQRAMHFQKVLVRWLACGG